MEKCKIILCILFAVILFVLTGCDAAAIADPQDTYTVVSDADQYQVLCSNGNYVLRFREEIPAPSEEIDGVSSQIAVENPKFQSIQEMVDQIRDGNFSSLELATIYNYFPSDENGDTLLFDMNALVEPTYPEDLIFEYVEWSGSYYSFHFTKGETVVSINFCSPEKYTQELKKDHTEFYDNERVTLHSEEYDQERDARVCYFSTSSGQLKNIHYTYETEGKSITICERYRLWESDTVPASIRIVGICDGMYFYAYVYSLIERPSYEWLQSLGLTKLEYAIQ